MPVLNVDWAISRSRLVVGRVPIGYPAINGLIEGTARARAERLGTLPITFTPARCRKFSCDRKKNNLSLTIGPPIDPPYWFKRSGFLERLNGTKPSKKFRASNASLRKYSNTPPWKAFPPDLVTTLIWPAVPVPYSAG